jgi:hypothetical protein
MTPNIAEIEKVLAGIPITFEDGRSAIYSTALLYDLLPNVQPVAPIETANPMNGPSVN